MIYYFVFRCCSDTAAVGRVGGRWGENPLKNFSIFKQIRSKWMTVVLVYFINYRSCIVSLKRVTALTVFILFDQNHGLEVRSFQYPATIQSDQISQY